MCEGALHSRFYPSGLLRLSSLTLFFFCLAFAGVSTNQCDVHKWFIKCVQQTFLPTFTRLVRQIEEGVRVIVGVGVGVGVIANPS